MAGSAPGQPPWPARVATRGLINRAQSETANRTGCQKSTKFKKSYHLPVHSTILWDGGGNNGKQNKNKKAITQISLGYGSRDSGLQVQKAQAATGVALPLQGHLPPDMREKSWTRHRRICEPRGGFQGDFFAGGCSLHSWDPALRPGRLQYHTSMTDCPPT